MRGTRNGRGLRAAVVGAGCLVVALPVAAGAAGSGGGGAGALVLGDIAGDAGGLNDQGEGLVGDRRGPVSFPQADLREVALGPLGAPGRPAQGFTVTFTLAGEPGPVPSAATGETTYAVVMQPTPDCRLLVTYLAGAHGGRGELQVGNGCDTPFLHAPLRSRTAGTSVRVEVPYGVGPSALRAGEELDDYYTFTSDGVIDLDTVYSRPTYVLPG